MPQLQQLPGVETAKFGQEVVTHLFQLTRVLRIGGVLLIALLAVATPVHHQQYHPHHRVCPAAGSEHHEVRGSH